MPFDFKPKGLNCIKLMVKKKKENDTAKKKFRVH